MSRYALVAIGALGALAAAGCGREAPISAESRARDRFVHDLAAREGLLDVWSLMSRTDLLFVEGLSDLEMIDPSSAEGPWHEVSPTCGPTRARPVRWMGPRVLVLARGTGDTRFEVHGHVNLHALYTRPRVTVTFDDHEIDSRLVDERGDFAISTVIPAAWFHGWSDVYVTLSSVSEPWRAPADLKVARLERVVWEPIDGAAVGAHE